MTEKEKKYPQLILKTDGTYTILIEENVEVNCNSKKSIERFTENKNFTIIGEYRNPALRYDD